MFKFSSSYDNPLDLHKARIESVDILRGLVMVLMALDHCRDFFHIYAFDYSPEDLRYSTPIVFYTRWISHFCAPVFIFLTGVSAFLYQQKNHTSTQDLAKYLLVRGAILVLLEITIVRFAWRFYIDYSSIGGLVIWAIGWSMIALAGLIYLPRTAIGIISLVIIFGHNLLDGITVNGNKFLELIWAFLHDSSFVVLMDGFGVNILYPVLPMVGLIGLGFYIGKWFTNEYSPEIRSGYLFYTGLVMIFLFFIIRVFQVVTEQYSYIFYVNMDDLDHKWKFFFKEIFGYIIENYAEPSPWTIQENATYSVMAFLNVTKYPMSLLYILMTLGPGFIFLSYMERKNNLFTRIMKVYGNVPLFYYVAHLFLIHSLAILLAVVTHLDKIGAVLKGDWKTLSKDYGFSMPVVYLMCVIVLAILYPACVWYAKLKKSGKYKFLSYF